MNGPGNEEGFVQAAAAQSATSILEGRCVAVDAGGAAADDDGGPISISPSLCSTSSLDLAITCYGGSLATPVAPTPILSGWDGSKHLADAVMRLERDDESASPNVDELESEIVTNLTNLVLFGSERKPSPPVTDGATAAAAAAHESIRSLGRSMPSRVCQTSFKLNDIFWVCRTCQKDPTMVVCHACYSDSDHDGHDVAFHRATQGGCCDCGDVDAWDPAGFCSRHGPAGSAAGADAADVIGPDIMQRARGAVGACFDYLAGKLGRNLKEGCGRVNLIIEDECDEKLGGTVSQPAVSREVELARLAREEGGLFLVLYQDDIHSENEVIGALRALYSTCLPPPSDSVLQGVMQLLHAHGELIVWGTSELVKEARSDVCMKWKEGDAAASAIAARIILDRARNLSSLGMVVSIKTRTEVLTERRAAAVLRWLSVVAESCDPLSQLFSVSVSPERHLASLLRSDLVLPRVIAHSFHTLLMTLLSDPPFKAAFGEAYVGTLEEANAEYARGVGIYDQSSFALSVQFINRSSYVKDLVKKNDLLGVLGRSLLNTLLAAVSDSSHGAAGVSSLPKLDPSHPVLMRSRYTPVVFDLGCVLGVEGMARLFVSLPFAEPQSDQSKQAKRSSLDSFLQSLALAQNTEMLVWRDWDQGHVEEESQAWYGAFNLSANFAFIADKMLNWKESEPPSGFSDVRLLSIVDLTHYVLTSALMSWQNAEMESYRPTTCSNALPLHKRCPSSLPMTSVNAKHGTPLAMQALPLAQVHPWSIYVPLHRFVAACVLEVCRRPIMVDGSVGCIEDLIDKLVGSERRGQVNTLLRGLMEFPTIILSRVAQIRAELWKRNGSILIEQVQYYTEPPYCRSLRDADVTNVQFAMIAYNSLNASNVGCAYLVNLLLHRFGVFDFLGFSRAPGIDVNRYFSEIEKGLYCAELPLESTDDQGADSGKIEGPVLPWTYSPARDSASLMLLLQELLHVIIILATELPLPPASADKSLHIAQAKQCLRRELIHRLIDGPKMYSELTESLSLLHPKYAEVLLDEGKDINPDDAAAAILQAALGELAEKKSLPGSPDKWELQKWAWAEYDPSFYHISRNSHQIAAEGRSAAASGGRGSEVLANPYVPRPPSAHSSFERIRCDLTADANVVAIVYRTLHMHCRDFAYDQDQKSVQGKEVYEIGVVSESVLARAVHILTLGAYAWEDKIPSGAWKEHGGSGVGSIFYSSEEQPTAESWVDSVLLSDPAVIMDCDWYTGKDLALILLKRLADDGGSRDVFMAQDKSIRSGAKWICDFATTYSGKAAELLKPRPTDDTVNNDDNKDEEESAFIRKKKEAKARAMARMKAMQDKNKARIEKLQDGFDTMDEEEEKAGGQRLFKDHPECSICFSDGIGGEDEDVLAFCGFAQASTVLKAGGGPPFPIVSSDPTARMRMQVGTHMSMCGHAVHNTCCESYMNTNKQKDFEMGEFRCPQCKRLSNCLVPFVDVGADWTDKKQVGRTTASPLLSGSNVTPTAQTLDLPSLLSARYSPSVGDAKDDRARTPIVSKVFEELMGRFKDVSYMADVKRIGSESLLTDCGKFRRYMLKKEDSSEWQVVTFRLFQSIKAFTYSCCAECAEIRRLSCSDTAKADPSKFGFRGLACNGELILLPETDSLSEDGTLPQAFNGRLGKLRLFALSNMVPIGAYSKDIVQLSLGLPRGQISKGREDLDQAVPPLLCGHVLSHIVAAMFAACGQSFLRRDQVEDESLPSSKSRIGMALEDCISFVSLGCLARVLQSLIGYMNVALRSSIDAESESNRGLFEKEILAGANALLQDLSSDNPDVVWQRECCMLIKSALSPEDMLAESIDASAASRIRFVEACSIAEYAAISYFADALVILQLLFPGLSLDVHPDGHGNDDEDDVAASPRELLEGLMACLKIPPIENMLEDPSVKEIAAGWYEMAQLDQKSIAALQIIVLDWPIDPLDYEAGDRDQCGLMKAYLTRGIEKLPPGASSKKKKTVSLLGGYVEACDFDDGDGKRRRIAFLPTVYSDLYAELSTLCPNYEWTSLCLVCGELLDARAHGICSKHADRCGGGCGIFFLVQECLCLLIHESKKTTLHSPYVDSHGETQFRGRPLKLDLKRYAGLQELWSGHLIRQRVVDDTG